MPTEVVYAVYTAWVSDNVVIHEDEAWPADHPIVREFPDAFTDVVPESIRRGQAPVEQATAAPGERRNTPRR